MIYRLSQQTLPQRFSKKRLLKALTVWLHPYPFILDARGAGAKQFAETRQRQDKARARRAALGSAIEPLPRDSDPWLSSSWIKTSLGFLHHDPVPGTSPGCRQTGTATVIYWFSLFSGFHMQD